MFQETN